MPVRGSRIGDKLLGVMEAYLDESGISDIGPVCVVGGYVGGYRQFRRLEAEWKEIVSCLPNGDFHAIDFFNRGPNGERYGVYEGWTDQLANDFFEALASAIDESGVHPVGAAADVKKFFEYDIDTRIYLTGGRHNVAKWKTSGSPHQPYYLPFQHCLTKGITYVQEGIRLNFICDVNKELSRYAKDLFEDYKKVNPRMYERFGMISYASRLDANIIQAADLLVYAHFCNQHNRTTDNWRMLQRLIRKTNDFRWYSDEGMGMALKNFQYPTRLAVQSNPQAARRDEKRKERYSGEQRGKFRSVG